MQKNIGCHAVVAVLLGILAGFFFGPLTHILTPVSSLFDMLLQMVVLPYICLSIIHGLGSMSPETGKTLFKKGWAFWVLLWGAMFAALFLLSYLIPEPQYGSMIAGQTGNRAQESIANKLLSYIVPENPIYDLANNVVPAIAVFGVIVGLALMHLQQKEPILGLVEKTNQIIEKILVWIAIVSPIGAFAHIAVITGTVEFADLAKLEFYVIAFIFATLVLTLWILPVLLSGLTPIRFSEGLKAIRTVCLLSFATGMPSIAIPFLNEYLKETEQRYAIEQKKFHEISQTVVPISYAFGQIGNCMILFFIFFISFFYRHPFSISETAALSFLTIPLSIGSSATSINAVSFLIDQLEFPDAALQLFEQTSSITLNFQVLLSTAGVLVFALLVLFSYYGKLQIKWKYLLTRCILGVLVSIGIVFLIKPHLRLEDNYRNLFMNLQISQTIQTPVSAKIYLPGEAVEPRQNVDEEMDPLEMILRTGILRVGYDPENIPYCYFNNNGELVGYDIAFAYELARDLDCKLEFIPLDLEQMGSQLSDHLYDIAMSAILMDEDRIQEMDFTHYYAEQDNVLVVPIKKRNYFTHLDRVENAPGLLIGALGIYKEVLARHFPKARLQPGGMEELVEGQADAWILSQVPALIWCLTHPGFTVVDYNGLLGKRYFAYPVKNHAFEFISFLNNWISLKEQDGFSKEQSNYWILGEAPQKNASKRWSLLKALLD